MRPRLLVRSAIGSAFALLTLAAPVFAAFVPVERFDGLLPGPIDGQGGWVAPSDSCLVVPAPDDPANLVLSVITESTYLHGPLALPDSVSRMLFLRFRVESQLNMSFGLSDLASPTRFDHFDVELSVDSQPMELRVNDGGMYRALGPVTPGHWYNCWVYVDNRANTTRVWLHDRGGDDANEGDRLTADSLDVFAFRNTIGGDMKTFYVKTGGGNGVAGPLLLDDVFLEDSEAPNLAHPAPGVAALPWPERPGALTLAPGRPNPFRAGTSLRFRLACAASVDLSVHDLGGRRVATLAGGRFEEGEHEVAWDGRTADGAPAAPGVYFVRLTDGTTVVGRRAVLLD